MASHSEEAFNKNPNENKRESESASIDENGDNKRVKVEEHDRGGSTKPSSSRGHPQSKRGRGRGKGSNSNTRDRNGRREAEDDDGEDGEGGTRLPKRKVAVHFGYCGIGYSGLQINHDVKTIEGDIFSAFCELGAVSKDNAVNPNKVSLQRAARTDRGVHAAGNLLTLKLILEPPNIGPGELVKAVNEKLPDLIRIWGFTRVQNSFNARTSCDSRQYEYLLPTYVFLPPKPGSYMYETMQKWEGSKGSSQEEEDINEEYQPTIQYMLHHPFWLKQGVDKTFAEDTAAKKEWRIPEKQLQRVREVFAHYEGSHNFHNFTVGKPFRDRSAHRHMIKLDISDPKIINGTEWLSIKFHGQSFMLHQIRKMIGLLVLIGRSAAPPSLVPETFGPARIHVPKAPGLGLLLEEPIFAGYNRRLMDHMKRQGEDAESSNKGDGGVLKEPVKFENYFDEMEKFKQAWIYDRIHQEEEEKHEYVKFLQYLDVLSGPDFEYLNPKGVIPQGAILKVGEHVRPQYTKRGAKVEGQAHTTEVDEDVGESDDEEALKGNQAELEG